MKIPSRLYIIAYDDWDGPTVCEQRDLADAVEDALTCKMWKRVAIYQVDDDMPPRDVTEEVIEGHIADDISRGADPVKYCGGPAYDKRSDAYSFAIQCYEQELEDML